MNNFARLVSVVCLTMLFMTVGLQAGEIHDVAAAGDLNKVKALLKADPTLLESKDNDGFTPLMTACRTLQVEVANYLLDNGANVNAIGRGGMTPLFCFGYDKEPPFDLIKRLVAKGADVNAKLRLNRNWTVLVEFVVIGSIEVTKFLIEHGADPNIRDIEGTPIHMAIHHNWPFCNNMADNYKLNEEMAKSLIECGAKLQEFSFGNMELHLSGIRGLPNLVPILVKYGANVNAVNDYGHTPLYYATRHGHRETAEALIAAGADKSAIVETNYGKASQLTEKLKEGEAYLWYLAPKGSPNTGYAVKTRNNLLIFDPRWINEAPEAGLANGYINPNELAGQKITMLIGYKNNLPDLPELAKQIPGTNFVLNFKPGAGNDQNNDMLPYRLAKANESFSIDGIKVHTIPACQPLFGRIQGLGYLVEADGAKIFHAGLHFSNNNPSNVAKFRKEIDFLKPFGPIDIAILPIKGRHLESVAYEPYLYLIDRLSPKAIYLIGEELANEEHRKCLDVLKARDVPVFYPDGGIAIGQRFHYQKPDVQEFTDLYGDYLGQTPPGDKPVVFVPGIVSTDYVEHSAPTFSPDGNEVFWWVNRGPGSDNEMWTSWGMTMRRVGDRWTAPAISPYDGVPVFSIDGKRLYCGSDGTGDGPYFVEKKGNTWSEPQNIGFVTRFPELKFAYQLSIARNGTLYFLGNASGLGIRNNSGIYRTELINGEYVKPELLPRSINLPPFLNWTPLIAPDESYLIFASDRTGNGDLYISFHDIRADTWSEPVYMGESINTGAQERFPGLSPDGKYLFFTRGIRWSPPHFDQDIFWVSAGIIDKLKAKALQEQHLKINTPQEDAK